MALSRFVFAAMRGQPVEISGDGERVREMTCVSDLVGATVAALKALPGGTYKVGGGVRASVNKMLDCLRCVLGTRVEACYGPAAEGDVRSTWTDSGRAERGLGFRPRVGLEEGVAAQVEWVLRESFPASTA